MREVHRDRRSLLMLDRPAIRWAVGDRRGFSWSERIEHLSGADVGSWKQAATAAAGCGLVVEGRSRYVHSSVSGVSPLYYLGYRSAVYFCTRIEPLATTAGRRLSTDWAAWAAILTLGYPLGERTPFDEIRRLRPFSVLRSGPTGPRALEGRWPWAEVDPRLDRATGFPLLLARLREVIADLPQARILCPLSGGLDSRLCLGLLHAAGRPTVAVTVDEDQGNDREQRAAAAVADALGVAHGTVVGDEDSWWPELVAFAERVEYQLVRTPWLMPLLDSVRRLGGQVVNGFGFDAFSMRERFFADEAIDTSGGDSTVRSLWRRLRERQTRIYPDALRPEAAELLWRAAEEQWLGESRAFGGHPSRALLTHYRTRQIRGVALMPHAVLGAEAPTAVPFVDDRVARANLAIAAAAKRDGQLYFALLRELHPSLAELPTTSFGEPLSSEPRMRRSQSVAVAEALHACLESGPLNEHLNPRVTRKLLRHRRGRLPRTDRAALGPVFFHLWHRRYRDHLRDPAAGLDLPKPG